MGVVPNPEMLTPGRHSRRQGPNAEMLILARQSRGYGSAELAHKIGVSPAMLSRAEMGSPLRDVHLQSVANELRYPIHFFFRPEHVRGTDSICFHHRKRKSMSAKLLTCVEAQMYVTQLQMRSLLEDVEVECPNRFYTLDPTAYDGDPRTVAQILRSIWHLPPGPIPNLVRVVEAAGGIVTRRDFGTRQLDGMSCWPKSGPPLFFLNSDLPVDRTRMTLAHELGHLVMHDTPPQGDPEEEATAFAAEFLAPEAELVSDLRDLRLAKLPGLKEYWRISMSALVMAARRTGSIPESRGRSLLVQLSQSGYRTDEAFPLSPEDPTIVGDAIKVHLREHGFTVEDLAALADLRPEEFRTLYLPDPDGRQQRLPFRVLS